MEKNVRNSYVCRSYKGKTSTGTFLGTPYWIGLTLTLIRLLDPSNVYGCDKISMRMLKLCGTSISKPLHILFNNSVMNEGFPNEWKKANIVPAHRKDNKQIMKNYRPVSLLPISSKTFGKIIFNSLFKNLEDINFLLVISLASSAVIHMCISCFQ